MKLILRICLPAMGVLVAAASGQQRYTVTDLKPLPYEHFSQANSVNNTGFMGGQSNITEATPRAVIWLKGWDTPVLIGAAGVNSAMFGINERGQGELQSEVSDQDPNGEDFCGYGTDRKCLPFLWQNNFLTPLKLLGGNNGAVGGINNRGEISGWAESATMDPDCVPPQKLDFEAVVWGPKRGELRRLRPLSEDTVSMSIWINDKGEAVGTSGSCADTGLLPFGHGAHPVLWDKYGSPLNIGMLDVSQEFGGIALSINNETQVVGVANQPDGSFRPFLWARHTGVRMLPLLPDGVSGGAVAINDRGDVIGQSFDDKGVPSPVIWPEGGDANNLNDLAPGSSLYLVWPTAINARGEISGFGVTADADVHGFLATPRGARSHHSESSADDDLRPPVLTDRCKSLIRSRFGDRRR